MEQAQTRPHPQNSRPDRRRRREEDLRFAGRTQTSGTASASPRAPPDSTGFSTTGVRQRDATLSRSSDPWACKADRIENAQRLSDLGVRLFTVGLSGPPYDLGQLTDWLAFRDEANRGTATG